MNKLHCLLALLGLALVACTKVETIDATQVLLSVQSELGSEAASYEARVTDTSEKAEGQRAVITKPPPFVFALIPPAGSRAETNLVIISALDAANNVIAVTKTLVTFRDRLTLQVDVHFRQVCRARVCDPGFSCSPSITGAAECLAVQLSEGTKIESGKPNGEPVVEGMTPDAGAMNGGTGGPGTGGAASGTMAGMDGTGGAGAGGSAAGGSASGGSASGGTASGGTASGGTASGGTASGGTASGGTASGGTASGGAAMGGNVDAGGVDAGPGAMPECDATRACSAGYSCMAGSCVSLCAQTTCDPNATCSLNASNAPVCACNSGYLTMTGAGGAVTCMKTQMCTDLRCDTNATCEAMTGQQPRCVCRSGYTGNGSSCAPVSCGALTVTNGVVQTGAGTFGQMATYTCDPGYTKTGGTARRCEATGMWSGTASTCEPVNCGTPPAPSHGSVTVVSTTRFNGTVRYRCDTGYTLSGTNSDTRTCTAAGTWSGAAPSCLGCGDGIVSASLFEQCELGTFTDRWSCINCQRSNGAYSPCQASGICPNGFDCHSAGYCTVAGCTSDTQCPPTPPGNPVRASCIGGFACTLIGCTATSQCPSGLRCDPSEGFCIL